MRFLSIALLSLVTSVSVIAAAPAEKADEVKLVAEPEHGLDEVAPDTTFNGQKVPPMLDLEQSNFDKEVGTGYWYSHSRGSSELQLTYV
jgi:protein disulfide-isomerase